MITVEIPERTGFWNVAQWRVLRDGKLINNVTGIELHAYADNRVLPGLRLYFGNHPIESGLHNDWSHELVSHIVDIEETTCGSE